MTNRPLTPLQAMITGITNKNNIFSSDQILDVDPHIIKNWEFSDRPELELGDIHSLAKEFKEIGQLQPCIVRPLENNSIFKYELIAGERRWRAALLADCSLKVVAKPLKDNEAALLQVAENESRENLSDYAKGKSYFNLIEKQIISQKDLMQKLGKSKQYLSAMLSFSQLPQKLLDAIGDMSKVSYRTSEEMRRLSNKSDSHTEALLQIASKIRTGKFGTERICNFVNNKVEKKASLQITKDKIFNRRGDLVLSTKRGKDGVYTFSLSKQVSKKISPFQKDLQEEITYVIEKFLTKSAAAD